MAFYSKRTYNPYKKSKSSAASKAKGNSKASRQTRDSLGITIKHNHAPFGTS